MKKSLILLTLMLAGCAETTMLGYPGTRYASVPTSDIEVYFEKGAPAECTQIAMTIPPVSSKLSDAIDYLRSEASDVGGNYVNIKHLGYSVGWSGSANKTLLGVIYRCNK